ncbi:hypothetical protein [Prosthecobacter sp.]|uniref:hypothetical protein n=1 Tax=Prosthecobacter sp. TaxID=1965333 RepID=UPI0037831D67
MKHFLLFLAVVTLFNSCKRSATGDKLQVDVKAGGELVANFTLTVDASQAVAEAEGQRELFNIREMSWLEPSTGQWVSLDRCKAAADQSKAQALVSAVSAPATMKAFLLWSLNPSFEVQEANGVLKLTSGQMDYVIEGVASQKNAERYFDYAVLNAYKKAMTDQGMPPFAELQALAEMRKLGCIPRKIAVTFPGMPEAPGIVMEISEK